MKISKQSENKLFKHYQRKSDLWYSYVAVVVVVVNIFFGAFCFLINFNTLHNNFIYVKKKD